jgi:hypothetical protein
MKMAHPVGDARQMGKNGKAIENYAFDPENPLDWWFKDCQRVELIDCWNYEYARECPAEIERAREWRGNTLHPATFDELIDRKPRTDQVVALYPEWPEHPYLSIPPEERKRRKELMLKDAAPLFDLIKKSWTAKATFTVFDWTKSDTELVEDFRFWLKRKRPKAGSIRESRGNAGIERRTRVRLKGLGAYRLARNMTANEVIAHAIAKGKPLYKNQPQLSKVCSSIEKVIRQLNSDML